MTIDIKDRETEALLDEIRTATGKEVGDILRDLARQEAERIRKERDFEERVRRLEEISVRAAAKIPKDAPSPDEIIGYDEWGLPA
ncbi:MAG TPA: type II toxin-antitoxin system VapB family antitoxin [Geminicoccaceae bacterium]